MISWNRIAVLAMAIGVACGAYVWLRDPLAPVVNAAKRVTRRPVEARLTGFSYAERPTASRGGRERDVPTMRLSSAASIVSARFARSGDARDLHLAGVAFLVRGRSEAVEKLREAAELAPAEVAYWNDLAAALYTRAVAESNPHDFAHALAAVDHALRLAPADETALFNRALILQGLHLRNHSAIAWERYVEIDGTSPWADEARQRAAEQRRVEQRPSVAASLRESHGGDESVLAPLIAADAETARRVTESVLLANWGRAVERGAAPEAESWLADARTIGRLLRFHNGEHMVADAVAAIDACGTPECLRDLAAAHRAYDEGRRAYSPSQRLVTEARGKFVDAARLFRAHGSPMALVADYYVANCLEDAGDTAVIQELERLLALAPERHPALRAQVWWQLGTTSARMGKTAAAYDHYSRALQEFTRLGEQKNATTMRDSLAAIVALLGRPTEAWRLRATAIATYSEAGMAGDVHRSLELAGRMEAVEGHWDEAASLFALAIAEPSKSGPRTEVSAMLWRALALSRAGLHDEARWQLGAARRFAWSIVDEILRESALEDLTFADAVVIRATEPARAATILDRYLASSERRRRLFLSADAHLERARASRTLGHYDDAERFYRSVVTVIDEQRRDVRERDLVDAYFATATAASNELTDLLESQSRTAEAFAALEHGRGRIVLERLAGVARSAAGPLTVEKIRERIPERTVLISYLWLDDQVLIFTLSRRDGLRVERVAARTDRLQREIRQFRAAIEADDARVVDAMSERLYAAFVAPVRSSLEGADTLVIVPDAAMERMPFAALRERGGPRIIERFALAFAPSASVFARAISRPPAGPGETLVFGNPAFDTARHPTLEPLPGAGREAREVARRYDRTKVAVGADATATRFLQLLPTARTIHLGSHAVTMPRDPMSSMLLLAPDGGHSGDVRADEIVRTSCRADVVVLAACQTSFSAETPSDLGTLSLAFLAAGARNVVGTLWNVDDEDAAAFSRQLHSELRNGTAPSKAVHRAQIDMLRTRPVRAWAAFTLTGAGN